MFIGQYEVVKTIGKGGMGTVFVARDPAIDRLVAIKLLRDGIDSPEVRERFKREARSAGKLRHPNIVTIFHVGDHENRPYIVMEYIPGETLAELIRQQAPLSIGRKLRIVDEICRGLAYAHKFGIVHRDIKPLNIVVDPEGSVKILDFGIARVGEQGLTQLGMMMGTPNYMSPEQISPGRADHRSDVFAVGLVLYEVLTCKRAFPGDDFSVLQKILQNEPEPIEKYYPGVDPELVQVIRRALAKKPDDRYQDLASMRQDIVRIWQRLKTPEDEGSGELAPVTPPEAPYDGPTLVPGPNEAPHAPATLEQQRAAELARQLARVAEEKRRAEQMAHTPPMGTPAQENPVGEPTLVQSQLDMKAIEQARADMRRKAAEAGEAAERAKRAEEARRTEKRASEEAKAAAAGAAATPQPPAADPTLSGPKGAPVSYTSTSEPTVVYRRPAEPPKPKPKPGDHSAVSQVPPLPPPAVAPPPVAPPLPKAPATMTTQNMAAAAAKAGSKPAGLPSWVIPVAAAALIALLFGLRMVFSGGSQAQTPESQASQVQQSAPPESAQAPAATTVPPAASTPAETAPTPATAVEPAATAAGQRPESEPATTTPAVPDAAQAAIEAGRAAAAAAATEQAAAASRQPRTTPPATTPASPTRPAAPSRAADTASIQVLLQQYAEAYAKMDVNALRTVWPGAPAAFSFAGNRSYTMNLRGPQLKDIVGDRALVTAERHTVQVLEDGQRREASVPITMNLRRISGGWVIDTIQQ